MKALPRVISWFERAGGAVVDEVGESYNIDARRLSAVYQFAQGITLMFVPKSHIEKASARK